MRNDTPVQAPRSQVPPSGRATVLRELRPNVEGLRKRRPGRALACCRGAATGSVVVGLRNSRRRLGAMPSWSLPWGQAELQRGRSTCSGALRGRSSARWACRTVVTLAAARASSRQNHRAKRLRPREATHSLTARTRYRSSRFVDKSPGRKLWFERWLQPKLLC